MTKRDDIIRNTKSTEKSRCKCMGSNSYYFKQKWISWNKALSVFNWLKNCSAFIAVEGANHCKLKFIFKKLNFLIYTGSFGLLAQFTAGFKNFAPRQDVNKSTAQVNPRLQIGRTPRVKFETLFQYSRYSSLSKSMPFFLPNWSSLVLIWIRI